MSIFGSKFFKTYLLPGFVFQSLIIGGGYGTGRELVEFFLTKGPLGGLFGMILSMLIWSLLLAMTFELSRLAKAYDYRSFINGLLGKGWLLYEFVYLLGAILVISVLGSAAGELTNSILNIPGIVGIIVMMGIIGVLVFYGTSLIEKALSVWSFALYAVYAVLIVLCISLFGDKIAGVFSEPLKDYSWVRSGIEYSAYNVGLVPAMLFVVRHIHTRREALVSGSIAGAIGMIPGIFIFIAMLSQYPSVLTESVPADYILGKLNFPVFTILFQIVLFGTFVETGVGIIHGFNERISSVYREKKLEMPKLLRTGISLILLVTSVFVADAVGIIDLIAKGYKALTWGYMLAFVIPVLLIGTYRIWIVKNQ